MTTALDLAKYLKQKREQAGLSQKKVAQLLDYSTPQFISNWERGQSTPPIKTIKKLSTIYKVPIQELVDLLLAETLRQVTVDFKKKLKKIL